MYRKYSASFKYIVVQSSLQGESLDEINTSHGANVSSDSLRRWCLLYNTTRSVVTNPETYQLKGRPLALNEEERQFVFSMVTEKPQVYLAEIQQELLDKRNVHISVQTISNELHQRLGLSQKTMRKVHPNQDLRQRAEYTILVANYNPEMLVFTGKHNFFSDVFVFWLIGFL
jgi:transposase